MTSTDIVDAFKRLHRRTRIALTVMGAAAVIGGLLAAGGEHMRDRWHADARSLQRELTGIETDTIRLERDIAFVNDNTDTYEQTLARGLFGDRNRLLARRALERQLVAHRLQGQITLHPRSLGDTHRIGRDAYTVLTAPVVISAGAMLDSDLFALMGDIGAALPGYLALGDVLLTREPLTAEKLDTLRNGLPVPLVRGRMTYHWLSAGPAQTQEATQ